MKTSPQESLSGIYEFRRIDDRLDTAGSAAQFPVIREAGFEAVVNLALPTSDNALANEGSIVTGLGMAYLHIPVNFQAPAARDFQTFCGVMEALQGRRAFVHCAANMRVSAFIFLYRVLRQGANIRMRSLICMPFGKRMRCGPNSSRIVSGRIGPPKNRKRRRASQPKGNRVKQKLSTPNLA